MSDVSSTRSLQAKLADLHIFVVPVDQWLDKYRTAFNNIALESVSAGFVRVHPDLSLHHLRECLEEQLGEEIVPEEFIFLRSVGRCMAVVKENQEHLLKVKDFLPPVAYSPEIFLLPGTHDTYARPGTDSSNVVIATQGHTTAGMSTTNPFHLPLINNQNLITQTGYLNPQGYHGNYPDQEDAYQPGLHGNMPGVSYQGNKLKQSQQDSFDSDKLNSSQEDNDSGHPDNDMRHLSDDLDDVDLTPRRRKKDKSSRESKSKKNKQLHDEELENNRAPSPVQHEVKTVKIIEPQVVHSMPYQGPDGQLVAPPTPIPTGRVIASPMPGPRKGKREKSENSNKEIKKKSKNKTKQKSRSRSSSLDREKVKNVNDLDSLAMLPSDSFAIPDIEDVEERSKYAQFPSPAKSTRSHHPYEIEMDSGIADDFNTPPRDLNDSFNNNKSNNKNNSNLQRQNGMDRTDEDLHNKHDEKDEVVSLAKNAKDNLASTTNINQDKHKNNSVVKTNEKDSKPIPRKPKKTVKKTVKKQPQDDLDERLKKLKQAAPPPIPVPDPSSVSFEKDTHSAKDRKQKIVEDLRGQLRKAKNERVDLEKQRDQKIRKAKTLQTQTLQKRNHSKNIWKKKFFDEKRKTAPLEEQLNRLRYDVEVQHKAILDLLENKDRDGGKGAKDQDRTPSDKTNQLMLLARAQNEVEDLRHKIEELKVKLASEMKLRDNAQRELKQLREDLIEKKINLTLTKSQKSLVVLNAAENITAQ